MITGALPALVGALGSDRPALPCGRLCLREGTDPEQELTRPQEGESYEAGVQGQNPGQAWGAVGHEKTVGGCSTFKGREGPEGGCHTQTSEDHWEWANRKQEWGGGAPGLLAEPGGASRSD